MNQDRLQQIDDILLAVLELEAEERSSFIEVACEDDEELKNEITSLLSFDERALDIDTPALERAACILAAVRAELAAGESFAHYDIHSLLGTGGMGEVYLAEDTRLGRKIALKLLPADFTKDQDRVQLFQQEARASSALNHPNIITIYDTGVFEGRHFIATELVEGETLRSRLKYGLLDLSETLDVAVQVANALLAAHRAGIVHRDIKPENIMLRPDGYVKILDFGLAKLCGQPSPADFNKSIQGQHDSIAGTLMGTVKYMSPEQALGHDLDDGSDIFSFGVVIYEMIAGCPPFDGKTTSNLIEAILTAQPVPLIEYSANTPDELQRIVSTALKKDRQKRYQSIKEMLADLKTLKHDLETGQRNTALVPIGGKAADPAGRIANRTMERALRDVTAVAKNVLKGLTTHWLPTTAAALVLLSAVALLPYTKNLIRGPSQSSKNSQTTQIIRLTNSGKARDAAISSDGKYTAYVFDDGGLNSVWVREIVSNTTVQVLPPTDVRYAALSFSRDNQSLYLVKYEKQPSPDENGLYQVSVLGGALRRVTGNVHSIISFSPDGRRFSFCRRYKETNETGLLVANADGTGEEELARRKMPDRFADYPGGPAWSPDGQMIACGLTRRVGDNSYDKRKPSTKLIAIRLDDRTEELIVADLPLDLLGLVWLADGAALILTAYEHSRYPGTSHTLYVSYPAGEVQSIRQDPGDHYGLCSTADSKTFVTQESRLDNNVWVGLSENMHELKRITTGAGRRPGLSWAPDGRIVYADLSDEPGNIWITDSDGANQKQLTFAGGYHPSVSADGRYIVFESGSGELLRMDIDGSNLIRLSEKDVGPPQCAPDGKCVIYQGGRSIWKVSIDGGNPIQLTNDAADVAYAPAISPEAKLIAYYSIKGLIEVIPLEGGEPLMKFPLKEADWADSIGSIQWAPDGQSIHYVIHFGSVSNIMMLTLDGTSKKLTNFKHDRIMRFAWSIDGRQFAITRGQEINDILLIETSK